MIKISRSKIDLFLECPRCFYLDVVKKIKRPPGFPFNLNNAVDMLLKKEFDRHREAILAKITALTLVQFINKFIFEKPINNIKTQII